MEQKQIAHSALKDFWNMIISSEQHEATMNQEEKDELYA